MCEPASCYLLHSAYVRDFFYALYEAMQQNNVAAKRGSPQGSHAEKNGVHTAFRGNARIRINRNKGYRGSVSALHYRTNLVTATRWFRKGAWLILQDTHWDVL